MKKSLVKAELFLRRVAYKRQRYLAHRGSRASDGSRKNPRRIPNRVELGARWRGAHPDQIDFPEHFSLVNNPIETLEAFDKIIHCFDTGRAVFLNAHGVKRISIDTLLYLLALLNKMRWLGRGFAIRGNTPLDDAAKAMFIESGFYKYMRSELTPMESSTDCVKIDNGPVANPLVAKSLCEFAMRTLGYSRIEGRGLYDLVMEIILNTIQHAYDRDPQHSKWYSYARYNREKEEVVFTLLDTGFGIPSTVQKNFIEVFQKILAAIQVAETIDVALIESALRGDFRTKTAQRYRGKGMPKIREYCDKGYIHDLTIISGRGFVAHQSQITHALPSRFMGTLYTWTMKRKETLQ